MQMTPWKLLISAVLIATASGTTLASGQTADDNAPVYIVSYISAAQTAKQQAINLLKQFRSTCAKASGNQRCEAVQRLEQQNEFAMLEVWKDRKSFQTHSAGPGAQFREKLKPLLTSPYDERVHTAFSVALPQTAPTGRVLYTITHIDIVPARLNEAAALLKPMAEASRKDAGNSRFEVLVQTAPQQNQFSFVEIWTNKRQLENHQALQRMVQFREKLQPFMEALYDERLFKVLD